MSYAKGYFEYTQFHESVKEKLPDNINFISADFCKAEYKNLEKELEKFSEKRRPSFPTEIINNLVRLIWLRSPDARDYYNNNKAIFSSNDAKSIKEVMQWFDKQIAAMDNEEIINNRFFNEIKESFKYYKTPVSYMARLVITRMSDLNPELLGDYADNWNEDAPDSEKSKIIAMLIMRQFILQFEDGMLYIPLKSGKTSKDKKYIRMYDKGRKDADNKRIADSDDYYCPEIKKLCDDNYNGSFENMAKNLTEADFEKLKEDKGCRLAQLAQQFSIVDFGGQKKDRVNMYVFAIAFELTFNNPALKETDITKCMFFDLYNNSFVMKKLRELEIQALTDQKAQNDREKKDRELTNGYAINYKNFVDIIYLYFISQNTDVTGKELTPALRLYRALKAIDYVQKHQKLLPKAKRAEIERKADSNKFLSDNFKKMVLEEMFKMNEDDFKNAIIENMVCVVTDPFLACEHFPLNEGFTIEDAYKILGEDYLTALCESCSSGNEKDGKKEIKNPSDISFNMKKKICISHCSECSGCDEAGRKSYVMNCDTIYKHQGWTGAHLYAYSQKTAFAFFTGMNKATKDSVPISMPLEEFRFSDEKIKDENVSKVGIITDIDGDSDNESAFRAVAEEVFNIHRNAVPRIDTAEKKKPIMSREKLIASYCRYIAGFLINTKNDSDYTVDRGNLISFSDFYDYFCTGFEVGVKLPGSNETFYGLNSLLIKSNFQPVSCSSLFDIISVFMTYRTCIHRIYGVR